MKVNLTLVFMTVAFVAVAGFVGAIVLTINNAPTEAYYGFLTTSLTAVIGFGGTLYGLNKLNSKTDEIKANVNGNLSHLIDLAMEAATTREGRKHVQDIAVQTGVIPTTEEKP